MDADWEAHQGRLFERNLISERCPRGRRGSPAKGVSGQKPDRGFESLSLRHSIVDVDVATTDNSRLAFMFQCARSSAG